MSSGVRVKVFISWSGTRGRRIAGSMNTLLTRVIQDVEAWMSPDMEKGTRWGEEITRELATTDFGISCLTPESIGAPWLNFEAGAISKLPSSRAYTFLVELEPAQVPPPLGMFQATVFRADDVFKLLTSISNVNAEKGGTKLDQARLAETFEWRWPSFESEIREAIASEPKASPSPSERGPTELMEEVLSLVRGFATGQGELQSSVRQVQRQLTDIAPSNADLLRSLIVTINGQKQRSDRYVSLSGEAVMPSGDTPPSRPTPPPPPPAPEPPPPPPPPGRVPALPPDRPRKP